MEKTEGLVKVGFSGAFQELKPHRPGLKAVALYPQRCRIPPKEDHVLRKSSLPPGAGARNAHREAMN